MIVAAVAVFVAQPELIGEMLWRWRVYGPLFMPRPGVSQRLDVYGYQLLLLGYGFVWASCWGCSPGAWSRPSVGDGGGSPTAEPSSPMERHVYRLSDARMIRRAPW